MIRKQDKLVDGSVHLLVRVGGSGTAQRGRPSGATTFEAAPAAAFGEVVRSMRLADGMAQEALAHQAGIERSHMGKIERGEHMPTLVLILRISTALGRTAGELLLETEARLLRLAPSVGSDR